MTYLLVDQAITEQIFEQILTDGHPLSIGTAGTCTSPKQRKSLLTERWSLSGRPYPEIPWRPWTRSTRPSIDPAPLRFRTCTGCRRRQPWNVSRSYRGNQQTRLWSWCRPQRTFPSYEIRLSLLGADPKWGISGRWRRSRRPTSSWAIWFSEIWLEQHLIRLRTVLLIFKLEV